MTEKELFEYLKENLELDIETRSVYTGAMNSDCLYEDEQSVVLKLEGKVISRVSVK